jgi:hypothetical protein
MVSVLCGRHASALAIFRLWGVSHTRFLRLVWFTLEASFGCGGLILTVLRAAGHHTWLLAYVMLPSQAATRV